MSVNGADERGRFGPVVAERAPFSEELRFTSAMTCTQRSMHA